MKAQELMLGSLVQLADDYYDVPKGTIFKVVEVYTDTIFARDIEGTYEEMELPEYKLEPIPITPEILEKNGFEYENNAGYVYDNYEGTIITCSTFISRLRIIKDLNILYDSQDYADIYVHTLQHALRLCGIEKEIEL